MGYVRRHLGSFALLWIVFQAATLSAFLPRECCPAHDTAVRAETDCHGASNDLCPMKGATGEECPMHAGSGSSTPAPVADCVMRALCGAPAGALALLIPVAGILPDTTVLSDAAVVHVSRITSDGLLFTPHTLDPPPPRSAA